MDPGVHLVGFVEQSVDGVVLAFDLRLEAETEALQSGQAAAHLIWVSQKGSCDCSLEFYSEHTNRSP